MADAAPSLRPGQIIDGKYRVERVLGQGGMAVVVAARHVELDELVAIKVILPERVSSADARDRFAREARAAVKIKSEHVARVMDVGALDDGTPYMVMEYLDGEDFAAVLERRKKIPPAEAIQYALQVTDALIEAHSLGIIHRDVKPANLFLAKTRGRPPTLKVLDFGISKVERHDRRRTETKEILGSPWYMAPEQLKSATSADPRSDVWSLGIILYEFVTGEVPFDGDSMTEVIVKVLHDPLPLGKLPRQLEPVIRRCLAKSAQARFESMEQVAIALRALASATPLSSPPAARISTSPVPRPSAPPEFLLGTEDVELISNPPPAFTEVDDDDDDDEGAIVDEAELLPSDPPPEIEGTTPIALPVILESAAPAPAPPPAPPVPEAPKVPDASRARHTQKVARTSEASAAEARPNASARRPVWHVPAALVGAAALIILVLGWTKGKPTEAAPVVAEPPSVVTTTATPPTPSEAPVATAPSALASALPVPPASAAPPATAARASAAAVASVAPAVPPPAVAAAAPPRPPLAVAGPIKVASAAPEKRIEIPMPVATPVEKPRPEDDATVAFDAVRRHQSALKQTCWEASAKTTAVVSVATSVDANGTVTSAKASAADTQLAQCVEGQVRTWTFPSGTARSLTLPIRFRR